MTFDRSFPLGNFILLDWTTTGGGAHLTKSTNYRTWLYIPRTLLTTAGFWSPLETFDNQSDLFGQTTIVIENSSLDQSTTTTLNFNLPFPFRYRLILLDHFWTIGSFYFNFPFLVYTNQQSIIIQSHPSTRLESIHHSTDNHLEFQPCLSYPPPSFSPFDPSRLNSIQPFNPHHDDTSPPLLDSSLPSTTTTTTINHPSSNVLINIITNTTPLLPPPPSLPSDSVPSVGLLSPHWLLQCIVIRLQHLEMISM